MPQAAHTATARVYDDARPPPVASDPPADFLPAVGKAMQLDWLQAADFVCLPDVALQERAAEGSVGPDLGRGLGNELVDRVASALKPATLKVSAAAAAYALHLGLVVKTIECIAGGAIIDFDPWPDATGEFAPDHPDNGESMLYAAAATPEAMDRLEAAYRASIQQGPEAPRGGAELGLALGYSAADVAAWLLNARRLARRDTTAAGVIS